MPQPLRRLRRHLPMNGEEPFLHLNAAAPPAPSAPPPHEWEPLRRLRRHLPMNGEGPFLHLNAAAPPAPAAPPPHEWGAAFPTSECRSPPGAFAAPSPEGRPPRRLRHRLPTNGEAPVLLAIPAAP